MASFPQIPKARFYSLGAGGSGSRDTAALWADLAQRGQWLEQNAVRACGWAQGTKATVVGAETVRLGDFLFGPMPRVERNVRVWIVATQTSGDMTVRASLIGQVPQMPDGMLVSSSIFSDEVAVSTTGIYAIDVDGFSAAAMGLRIEATGESGSSHVIDSISIVAQPDDSIDGIAPATTWPATAIEHVGDDDAPDDTATLKRLRDAQAVIAGRSPRGLATRAIGAGYEVSGGEWVTFGEGQVYSPGVQNYRFIVWRGNETGPVTVAIRAKDNDSDGISFTINVDAISDTTSRQDISGLNTEVISLTAIGSQTAAWHAAELSGCWTANSYHYVRVALETNQGGGPPAPGGTGEVRAIVITEDEYDSATYLASGDSMPAGPRLASPQSGSVIAATHDGTAQYDDRRSLAASTAWQGWRRSQLLAMDSPYATVGAAGVSVAATDGGDPLWYGRHRISRGASGIDLHVCVRRSGMLEPDKLPLLTLYVDGVATDSTLIVPAPHGVSLAEGTPFVWRQMPRFAGAPGVTYELELRGGFVDYGGVGETAADKLMLTGVSLRETPGGAGNLFSDNVATGTDDGETTTGFTGLVGGETLASVTTQAHTGKRSLEVAPAATTLAQGVYAAATATESVLHEGRVWVRSSVARDVSVYITNETEETAGPINSATLEADVWTLFDVASGADVTAGDELRLTVRDDSDPAITTALYVDTLEIFPT